MGRQRKNIKEGREARHRAVLFAPLDMVLSLRDVVQPDLFLISNARMHRLTRENVQGAPDLVVEVVSESSRPAARPQAKARLLREG